MRCGTRKRTWARLGWAAAIALAGCSEDAASDASLGRSDSSGGNYGGNQGGDGDGSANYGAGGSQSFANPVGSGGALGVSPGGGIYGSSAEEFYADGDYDGEPTDMQATEPRVVNPFVVVAHDPFSTFAADVDTASFDAFLRAVDEERTLEADRVRLEEFVNSFEYDYPLPAEDDAHPFTISLQAAPNPLGRDTTLLRVGVQAKELLQTDHSAGPANIVFLADVSGSMQSSDKLPLVKRVMHQTVALLNPEDRVAIVTYASGTGVALASTPVSEAAKIERAIDGLSAGGSTNGAGGINLAYMEAESGRVDGINHVVLLTDGDFNVGPSSDAELVSLIEEKRRSGVTLTALGFGYVHNDSMMEAVTNAGNGIYGLITSQAQADKYVDERMLSTLVHAAKDMKLQVEWNPEHVHAYRLLGYENRDIADMDFRNDSVDAGEVGSGHQVTALYEVVLSGDAIPEAEGAAELDDGEPVEGDREVGAGELVRVKVRYKDPQQDETASAMETAVGLAPTAVVNELAVASADTRWAIAIAGLAELFAGSPYASQDNWPVIAETLTGAADGDADRTALVDKLDTIEALLP